MSFVASALLAVSCVLSGTASPNCLIQNTNVLPHLAEKKQGPVRSAEAVDVVLTAASALAWDVQTNTVLYQKNDTTRRPVASLVKLLSTLVISEKLPTDSIVAIPSAVKKAQAEGAHIRLPVGEHAHVNDLLAASLIASANDAVVTLAYAAVGDEESFVKAANERAGQLGLVDTLVANATGLSGGDQYSTARDVRELLSRAYANPRLGPLLNDAAGSLVTTEGTTRAYKSTDDLLATYLPILAAKTGYTLDAGENVALLTHDRAGHTIGIIILGSQQRFQDAKILAEWIERHYTWY